MLMHVIGKLSKDQKADWPKHLPELVHAYNSMRSATTRYSPHYLMFWALTMPTCWLLLPYDMGMEKHQCVDCYIAKLLEWLQEAFKEVQEQSTAEAKRQKWYYDRKANAVLLEQGDLVSAKADTYKGKRKVKDQWEEEPYEVVCQVTKDIPLYLMKNKWTGHLQVLHQNSFSSLPLLMALPFVLLYELTRQGALPLLWRYRIGMCGWYTILCLFLDNSDSPSIVEQWSQKAWCSIITSLLQFLSLTWSYALCLVPSFLQHG